MLRKSSKCENGKSVYNSEFACENVCVSDIRSSSTNNVSHFNTILPKNVLKFDFKELKFHRDVAIRKLAYLYDRKKPVFQYIRLASIGLRVVTSEVRITKLKTKVIFYKLNFNSISNDILLPLQTQHSNYPLIAQKDGILKSICGENDSVKKICHVKRHNREIHSKTNSGLFNIFHNNTTLVPSSSLRMIVEALSDVSNRLLDSTSIGIETANVIVTVIMTVTVTVTEIVTKIGSTHNTEYQTDGHPNACFDRIRDPRSTLERFITKTIKSPEFYSCLFTHQFKCINCVKNVLNYVSIVSIAKARSSLDYPSIITSFHCRSIHHTSMWSSSLSFNSRELRLRPSVSLGIQILPARVPNTIFFNNTFFDHEINFKKMKLYSQIANNLKLNSLCLKSLIYHTLMLLKGTVLVSWLETLLLHAGDVERNPGPQDVTLITLNCRGLKNEHKFRQLINRIQSDHHSNLIVALQETHVKFNNLSYTWRGKHIFTESNGAKGGIITLLSDNIAVREQIDLDNEAHIAVIEILDQKEKQDFVVVNLHSPCAHNQSKIEFFKNVKAEIDNFIIKYPEANVIVMGDYNTTFEQHERIGTSRTRSEITVAKKIETIFADIALKDCWEGVTNNPMTWRHGDKMSRLDRIQWSKNLDLRLNYTKTDWSYTQSDHCAVVVKLGGTVKKKFDKIVRIDTFFMSNVLLKHNFIKELRDKMEQIHETNMNPHQKLEYLKMSIRSTALEIAANYKKERNLELSNLRRDIRFWQSSFEKAADDTFKAFAMTKLDETICKRDKILDKMGEFICNRLKSKWYQEGEKGTKYFLNMQKSKGNKLELESLIKDNIKVDNPEEIDKMVEEFYKKLYEKGNSRSKNASKLKAFLSNLDKPNETNIDNIINPLTLSDLHTTLTSCKDSSPGPDGIPYSLIKLTWNYFGPLLLDSWNYAIQTGSLTHSHEESYLKLLPKDGKDPNLLKNWRPITLSNCDLKIITKTFANKLSSNLKNVISHCQTAYMKDRQISDNLHILQFAVEKCTELDSPSMIVSLDAEKAFDSVEHWYIEEVLKYIGLEKFINIFNLLYKNQKVSIHINNRIAGHYTIKNGVKQGDALSCILFILSIEPLLRNINKDENIKPLNIKGVNIPKAVAYADDVACIIVPTQHSLQRILTIIRLCRTYRG